MVLGDNPWRSWALARRALPGCIPAMYKLRGTGNLGDVYEWLSQVKEGSDGPHLRIA